MQPDDVTAKLSELDFQPLTSSAAGALLYHMVLRPGVEEILELGFAHGTSTAYMAAALHEKGSGRVTTVDRRAAMSRRPNIDAVLRHVGLDEWARPVLADRSYTWELMHMLQQRTEGSTIARSLDFCFIDGAHTWDTDGFAFLLVDKLLRPDRWMVFDDVNWTLGASPTVGSSSHVRALPEEERLTPQVRKIVDLLVRPLGYAVWIVGAYAVAYKPDEASGSEAHLRDLERIVEGQPAVVRDLAFGGLREAPGGTRRPAIA